MFDSRVHRPRALLSMLVVVLLATGCTNSVGDGADDTPPPNSPQTIDTTPPTVPQGATANAQSPTSVALAWQASTDIGTGVAGYRIYRNGGSAPIATVTGTSYVDNSLTPNTLYTYTIRAIDAANPPNESASSISVSATTPAAPPAADTTPPTVPQGLVATPQSTTQILITWQPSTDAGGAISGYQVFRDGGTTPHATVTVTQFADQNLIPNTRYTYTVRALDSATPPNRSDPSAAVTATTPATPPPPDVTPPTVPQGVVAAGVSTSQIDVSWQASTDAGSGVAGYRIFRNGSANPIATVTITNYSDTGLAAGTQYSYTVRAVDRASPANVSADSAVAIASTLAPPPSADTTPPTVPQGLTANATSSTQIDLAWQASTDAGTGVAGYRIFRDGGASPIAAVTGTTYSDVSLTPATRYTYTVRAIDRASPPNVSGDSAAASATTQTPPPPADTIPPTVPQGLTATPASPTQINLSWQASTDAGSGVAGYRIFRNGGATPLATVTGTAYSDIGLTPATQYTYTVRAVDRASPANESGASTPATATTPDNPPPPDTAPPTVPQGLIATAVSPTQINLTWQASTDTGTGVAGYRVFRNGGTSPVATVTTTSYSDTGLTAATQYTYTVRAFDRASPANVSADSAPASATTQSAPTSGLDSRPNNTSCVAGDRPQISTTLAVQRAFSSLSFNSPIGMLQAPNDASRWFIIEQAGRVRVFANQANVASSSLFVDIAGRVRSGGEMGLLGMAFHPNFPTNPRVYLSYTTNAPGNLTSRISEFQTRDGGVTLDSTSEVVLLAVAQPADNHNGGHIAFGSDGFLYIGFGDGGGAGDPFGSIGNGQNLRTVLGKLLRIDINGATGSVPYRIPGTNPFAGGALCNTGSSGSANCPEIYAYGLRNPWRWSFDSGSGELWLADVGQGALEEVNRVTLGGNYGWRCFEGTNSFNSTCGPNAGSSLPPIAQYGRSLGQSVTGGYVYRGTAIPSLVGRYVFGDFATGRLWHIARDTTPTATLSTANSISTGLGIASFGQGSDGEIYIVNYSGTIHRLVANTVTTGGNIPNQITATGCIGAGGAPASGLIPYAPSAPFWSDGATKARFMALQNGTTLGVAADGDVTFPNGTVLVKSFSIGSQLVETRLFMRHTDGEWAGYTYEWNAQGTEATRVVGGKSVQVAGQTWIFPSEDQCLQCHTAVAGRSLGPELQQLNGSIGYPQTGRTANQLVTLNAIQLFSPALTSAQLATAALPNPTGTSGTLSERARAYLHTNCSNCHRPGGPTPSNLDLRYSTALASTNACNVTPSSGDLGIANARLIAPGDAARSVLVVRTNRRDAQAMPPLSSSVVDAQGVALLTNWVNSLTSCN